MSTTQPLTLQDRLHLLLQSWPEDWAYAIFWRASGASTGNSGNTINPSGSSAVHLYWGNGHFRGAISSTHRSYSVEPVLTHDNSNSDMTTVGSITDVEWFFTVSSVRFFNSGDQSAPIRALESCAPLWLSGAQELQMLGCERSQDAHKHGVQTLVYIPMGNGAGVLELGSLEIVAEKLAVVEKVKRAFPLDVSSKISMMGQKNSTEELDDWKVDHSEMHDVGPAGRSRKKKQGNGRKDKGLSVIQRSEAEQQRRNKLNHRFHVLRSVVPNITRMDKASLLADTVEYIGKLKTQLGELEAKAEVNREIGRMDSSGSSSNGGGGTAKRRIYDSSTNVINFSTTGKGAMMELEVRMLGADTAMIRAQSETDGCAPARLMDALRDLNMQVHHASISTVGEQMVQDVVASPPNGLQDENVLKATLLAVIGR